MSFASTLRHHGIIPFVQIDPTDASVAAIAHGTYDEYLRSYADSVRNFGARGGHRVRARDERALVLLGLQAHRAGHVRRGLAAPGHAVPQAGRGQRDLAVDGGGGRAQHRAGAGLVARGQLRDLGRGGRVLLPADRHVRVGVRQDHQPGADSSPATRCCCRRARSARRPGRSPRSWTCSTACRQYNTLGLVWFDKKQSGGTYRQDWRLEDSPTADRSVPAGREGRTHADHADGLALVSFAVPQVALPAITPAPGHRAPDGGPGAGPAAARSGRPLALGSCWPSRPRCRSG